MAPPIRSNTHKRRGTTNKIFPGKDPKDVANSKPKKSVIRPLGMRNAGECNSLKPKTTAENASGVKMVDTAIDPTSKSARPSSPTGEAADAVRTDCLPVFHSPCSDVFQDNMSESIECYSPSPPPPPPPPPRNLPSFESRPPTEVTIIQDSAPPSPIRNPNFDANPRSRRNTAPDSFLRQDIDQVRMKSCLYDAMRLVRVILGSEGANLDHKSDGGFTFSNGSILRAIRSYALMRQELQQLQMKVGMESGGEQKRDDENTMESPIILPSLSSPSRIGSTSIASDAAAAATVESPTRSVGLRSIPPIQSRSDFRNKIIEAAKKIQSLDKELKEAKAKIVQLENRSCTSSGEAESKRANIDEEEGVTAMDNNETMKLKIIELEKVASESQSKYDKLNERHNRTIQEYKDHAEEIALHLQAVPRSQVEPKKAQQIRSKLQSLVHIVAKHTSQAEIDRLHAQLDEQQKKSQKEIEVLTNQLSAQQSHFAKEELKSNEGKPMNNIVHPTSPSKASGECIKQKMVEDILLKLNAIPTASVPPQERTKIRNHVRNMLKQLGEAQSRVEVIALKETLSQTQKREAAKSESLEKTLKQLRDLESTSRAKIKELRQQFDKKSQALQSDISACKERECRMESKMKDSTEDNRRNASESVSDRLQSLYVEHEALMSTVKSLEEELEFEV